MNQKMAEYFKILSDPNRLKIVELLLRGETCGCTLIDKLPISQPTLSYHLNLLAENNLSTQKRDGNKIEHFVDRKKIEEIIEYLKNLLEEGDKSCKL
jgi:ArsR family transcriptional regulator